MLVIEDVFEKIMPRIFLLFCAVLVTAASYSGWFTKWRFHDDVPNYGFERIMDGTGERPFVHRQLLPMTTKFIVKHLPQDIKGKLEQSSYLEERFARVNPPDKFHAEYVLMYWECYFAFLVAILILRSLLIQITNDKTAATLSAFIFTIIFPLFETNGGFYYDFLELFFFSVATYSAYKGKWIWWLSIIPFAELNKETFLFYELSLIPFLYRSIGKRKSTIIVLIGIIISSCIYAWLKIKYAGNIGGVVDYNLAWHIKELFDVNSYIQTETNYGIKTGSRMFFLHVMMVLWLIKKSWGSISVACKQHAKLALMLTLPLYLLFCAPGELRNLSFMYITFCILITYYIQQMMEKSIGK